MAEPLVVTKFFCLFGDPMGLHRDQGQTCESKLLQVVVEGMGVSKTKTSLHPVRWNCGTLREDDRVPEYGVLNPPKEWVKWLPIFLPAYRASNHKTTDVTPTNMVFG